MHLSNTLTIIYDNLASNSLIPQLFKTEYSILTAVLCKTYGIANIQLAEDIVSETFLLASETWGKKGIPENQVGWLYTVAKNKCKDYLKRNKIFQDKVAPAWIDSHTSNERPEPDFSDKNIQDSQLQMLFAICHPSLSDEAQIGLALRILCGFGIDEIADAFLSKKDSINKRLYRAKEKLRKSQIQIVFPPQHELPDRLENVLRILYLLFNEGYFSRSQNRKLRKDFCLEAMRLNILLLQYEPTKKPQVYALLALMCFHASRFNARNDEQGEQILYHDQDTSLWDKALIRQGETYMNHAATGERLSKYHLEAAIAYWHTQEDQAEKWEQILQLYNYLLQIEYSPIAALNRTYALSQVKGVQTALAELQKIPLENHHLYQVLLADFYLSIDPMKCREHLEIALQLAKTATERYFIHKKIEKLS